MRTDAVLEALAVYRATKLLQDDDIPPLPELRDKLMARYGHTPWSQLLDCPWCLSIWLGGVSTIVRAVAPRFWRIGVRVLASSAVTGVISEWLANMQLPELAMEAVESMERATEQMNKAADQIAAPRDMTRRSGTGEDEAARLRARLSRD